MRMNSPVRRRGALRRMVAAGGSLLGLPVLAQSFPARPIRVVYPAAPGSTSDLVGRQLSNAAQGLAGVPLVSDNRAGANGVIGVQAVMAAPADGYTLLFTTMSTMAINKALVKALPYDPMTDFVPLVLGYRPWLYVVVSAKLPYRSLEEFISAAKREPGKFNFGHSTATLLLAGKLLEQRAGVQFASIPYKSHPTLMQDLVAGQVDLTIVDPVSFGPLVKAGQLRRLGSASPTRLPGFGDVPTLGEAGVPNCELSGANICMVRAGTPPEIVAKLSQWLMTASTASEVRSFLTANNLDSFHVTGAEASSYLAGEIERWGSIARSAGVQPS